MLVLKCKMCGGQLNIKPGETFVECEYCGAKQALEYDEQKDFDLEQLLKRAYMLIEDGDFEHADERCEQVLNKTPENAAAYVGKLMADLKVRTQEGLGEYGESFGGNSNYQKAVRFADDDLKEALEGYLNAVNDRISLNKNQKLYDKAVLTMEFFPCEEHYTEAAELFESIIGFKDSEQLAKKCRENAKKCRAEEIEVRKKHGKIALIVIPPIVIICVVVFLIYSVVIPGNKYNNAKTLLNEGKYDEAIVAFEEISEYKDSADLASKALFEKQKSGFANLTVGSEFKFGLYEQDNKENGKEEIDWIVIAEKENRFLVLSKFALECKEYNDSYGETVWADSSIRKWLNDDFLNTAFGTYQQDMILKTTVQADDDLEFNKQKQNDTKDKVFLLSLTEVEEYFAYHDDRLLCEATEYTLAQEINVSGADFKGKGNVCNWWLRTPGSDNARADYIRPDCIDASKISDRERKFSGVSDVGIIAHFELGVRPAMWIEIPK